MCKAQIHLTSPLSCVPANKRNSARVRTARTLPTFDNAKGAHWGVSDSSCDDDQRKDRQRAKLKVATREGPDQSAACVWRRRQRFVRGSGGPHADPPGARRDRAIHGHAVGIWFTELLSSATAPSKDCQMIWPTLFSECRDPCLENITIGRVLHWPRARAGSVALGRRLENCRAAIAAATARPTPIGMAVEG